MAAQEYYLGTQAAHELPGSHPPNPYSSQPQKPPQYQQPPAQPYPQQNGHNPAYANTPPPSYSAYPQQSSYQPHGYPPQQQYQPYPEKKNAQPMTAPYPQTPPAGYYPPQQLMPQPQQAPPQNNDYLGAPLQHYRSHSQPARVRFADQDSDRSTSLGSMSDSDEYSPPRHSSSRHHGQYRSHSTRDYDSDRERERERGCDRDRDHRRHKPKKTHSYDKAHEDKHKNRDTFLGAGAGTIIGDAIFPGLGTAAGLVLGGYGGRKYADTRSKSDYDGRSKERRRSHGASRRLGDDGWDEKTRTYRKGAAVR